MGKRSNRNRGDGVEATGVGVGTFIVGVSRFLPKYPNLQSFLVFIAPFAAVIVNTYVRRVFDNYQKTRLFNQAIKAIDIALSDPRTSETRRQKLQKDRESLFEAKLAELIDQTELTIQQSGNKRTT
jgi:hypothetical protein